jgi:hypothetical protein
MRCLTFCLLLLPALAFPASAERGTPAGKPRFRAANPSADGYSQRRAQYRAQKKRHELVGLASFRDGENRPFEVLQAAHIGALGSCGLGTCGMYVERQDWHRAARVLRNDSKKRRYSAELSWWPHP